jgi:4,5-DOPA dioxygenase extradiol
MLSPLREEGVLILGSGNVVHNLASYAWETPSIPPFDWAARFEREVRRALLQGDDAPLIEYENPAPTHRCPSQRRTITCRFSIY